MAEDLNTPELETLARYLDRYREVVVWKLDGVDEERAKQPLVPSGTSLLGIVKHLVFVERFWFQTILAGEDGDLPWSEEDPDADWRVEPDESLADIVALYEAEIAESHRVQDGLTDPDGLVAGPDGEPVSVRRVLIHLVEEIARHAGHADILREQIDGTTGCFPGDEDD